MKTGRKKIQLIGASIFFLSINSYSYAQNAIDAYPDYFLGKDGWVVSKLDYTDITRFRDVKSEWPQAHFDLTGKIVKALEGKNIKVVLAIVPQRLNVYPQMLPDDLYNDFIKSETSYEEMLPEMVSRGVDTVDLLKAIKASRYYKLPAATYYRFEAHWNLYGAYAAAGALAKYIASKYPDLMLSKTQYMLTMSDPVSRKDIYWLDNLPKDVQAKVHPDYEIPYDLKVMGNQGDLLGESVPDVTDVGTSFSGYGLIDSLKADLQSDILNVALPGKGMWTPMSDYLKSNTFRDHPPKLIIWEMPEYVLENYPMPTDDEMIVFNKILGVK